MFGAIGKHFLHRKKRLTASLSGVAGHTGVGVLDYIRFPDGHATFDIALHGVAGTRAVVHVDDAVVSEIPINNGHSAFVFDTRRASGALFALPGDKVEIRQHGVVILQGRLKKARKLRRAILSLFQFR